jgi:hypothetical protein
VTRLARLDLTAAVVGALGLAAIGLELAVRRHEKAATAFANLTHDSEETA